MPAAVLPVSLAFLMFVVGLRLKFSDFVPIVRHPLPLVAGLTVQIALMPISAWLISRALSLSDELSLGLMILAVSPGGITSNYVTMLAKADVALSSAMTLVTSLAASISIPTILSLDLVQGSALNFTQATMSRTALLMSAVSALPLLLAMLMHRLAPALANAVTGKLLLASKLVFAFIVLLTFYENWDVLVSQLSRAGLACFLLNLLAVTMGGATIAFRSIGRPQAIAIAIECGLQNAAVSIFVAHAVFGDDTLSVPALIYAIIMNVTALGLVALGKKTQTTA